MSRIDELIAEHCPNGVQHKTLGEVGSFVRGNGLQKKDLRVVGVGAIHYGQVFTTYGTSARETKSFVDPELAGRLRMASPGDLVIATTSENDADVCKAVAWLGDDKIAVSGDAFIYSHSLDPMFVAYYFQAEAFSAQKRKFISGTKVRRVSGKDLARIEIPVPPLAVQREITRVLQAFDDLDGLITSELQHRQAERAELARRLITTSGNDSKPGASRVRLGEIANQVRLPVSVDPDKTYASLGVSWYGGGVLVREPRLGASIKASTLYRVKANCLIFNRMFVTEGSFALTTTEIADAVVSNEFPVYELDRSRVVPEWLLLYLLDEYSLKRIEAETTGTERGTMKSRRRWKEEQFEAFELVLPPIEEQRMAAQAVGAAVALEAALRDEQAARRKQQAFYRDKLLTFEEAV